MRARHATRVDFAAAGLLEGLDGEERTAREDLLRRLCDAGVPVEELRQAVAEERLALLPVERVMEGSGLLTAREIEGRTGMPAEVLVEIRRAAGLPPAEVDEPVFGEHDVRAAEAT